MNRNVVLFALYSLLTGAGNAICFFVLLSPLLFLLTGDPLFVGYAEGVQGLCSALVAIPAGLLADKWSRAGVARVGLSLSLLVYAAMATVVWLPLASMPLYWIMFALLALEGLGFGVSTGPLAALMSDSTPTGEQSKWQTVVSVSYMLGSLGGPLSAMALIALSGRDEWTLADMAWPWVAGLVLRVAGYAFAAFMSDAQSLGRASEDIGTERVKRGEVYRCCCFTSARAVPYLLVAADLLSGVASGMTIKFFPLWLEKEILLNPLQQNGVVAGQFLAIGAFQFVTQRVSKRAGRVQTVVGAKLLGLTLLSSIIVGDGAGYWRITPLICTLHVLRTGLMNSGSALTASILADYTPKHNRGVWKAMDMIVGFGWSGSALFGALMLDRFAGQHEYRTLFLLTLALQSVALGPLVVLGWLVPRREDSLADLATETAELATEGEEGETDPLLQSDVVAGK